MKKLCFVMSLLLLVGCQSPTSDTYKVQTKAEINTEELAEATVIDVENVSTLPSDLPKTPTIVSAYDVSKITPDMTYMDIAKILGYTQDIGSGVYLFVYVIEGYNRFTISAPGLDCPLNLSGEKILSGLDKPLNDIYLLKDEEVGDVFEGYDGSFVLYDMQADFYQVYNAEQAYKRVSPCSTFKVPNSLIGLESGVITGKDHLYKWDGTKRFLDAWNQDHTLESAIQVSAIWYYQQLASEVGEEKMQYYLEAMDYGNQDISGGLTEFWLGSTLAISPMEQAKFFSRLAIDQLPFSDTNMSIVRSITVAESNDDYTIYGKTGSSPEKKIGWYVGIVFVDNTLYSFATNILGGEDPSGSKAKEISYELFDKLLFQ